MKNGAPQKAVMTPTESSAGATTLPAGGRGRGRNAPPPSRAAGGAGRAAARVSRPQRRAGGLRHEEADEADWPREGHRGGGEQGGAREDAALERLRVHPQPRRAPPAQRPEVESGGR